MDFHEQGIDATSVGKGGVIGEKEFRHMTEPEATAQLPSEETGRLFETRADFRTARILAHLDKKETRHAQIIGDLDVGNRHGADPRISHLFQEKIRYLHLDQIRNAIRPFETAHTSSIIHA